MSYYEKLKLYGKKAITREQMDNLLSPLGKKDSEKAVSIGDQLWQIEQYIQGKGFCYEPGMIENFYLSLKSKPFLILAGTSGTGKSRLVKLFAEAVGATTENGRYKMTAVRPDWSDSSDLFGHTDLNGQFVPGAILGFLKQAEVDPEHPYFLCLDEMNLARVEYYLSDFLAIMETREMIENKIVSAPLIDCSYYGSDVVAAEKYGVVRLPENFYLIGTVNMDETTFPFSRKVLDRANTIEFSAVDLMPHFPDTAEEAVPQELKNDFLRSKFLLLLDCAEYREIVERYCVELQKINRVLQQVNAQIGYRVRDEIVFYMLNNCEASLFEEDDAMDRAIMQKILPRLQGSSVSVLTALSDLFKICVGGYEGIQTKSNTLHGKMYEMSQNSTCKYKKSAEKISFMVKRYEEDGFTSYWV